MGLPRALPNPEAWQSRAARCPALLAAVVAALMLPALLGCVTPLPRPETTTPLPTEAARTPQPSPSATATATPTPDRPATPKPTATRPPTPTPEPPRPTVEPTQPPAPTDSPGRLILQVYAPEDGASVPGSAVTLYGQTSPGARVFVAGSETEVDAQGGFRAYVPLEPGENTVLATATNDDGERREVSRRITSLALPFLLLVTEPENESVVSVSTLPLSGRTGPNAIVSINGRSVVVGRFGYFSSTVPLDEGPNVIDVVATNDDGQTLSTVLAVIYRPASE